MCFRGSCCLSAWVCVCVCVCVCVHVRACARVCVCVREWVCTTCTRCVNLRHVCASSSQAGVCVCLRTRAGFTAGCAVTCWCAAELLRRTGQAGAEGSVLGRSLISARGKDTAALPYTAPLNHLLPSSLLAHVSRPRYVHFTLPAHFQRNRTPHTGVHWRALCIYCTLARC